MTNKEWSAVATLLNEINKLRKRIEALEIYTWAYMTRWTPVVWYEWRYEDLWPRPNLDWIPEWIDTNQPIAETNIPIRNVTVSRNDTIYATTNDNITIPLTWISWHYGWTAHCTSINH